MTGMAKPKAQPVPASDEDVWWTGLRWVEGAWMQTHRFEDAFRDYRSALLDAETRARCNEPEGHMVEWRESYDRRDPYDPERPICVPTVALAMQYTTELDFLMVAVRNVLRAQERLPADEQTEMTAQRVLKLLRDVAEHWDEVGGRSSDELASKHPDVLIGAIAFTNKEIWVGDVPLSRIRAWLARVRRALITALTSAGVTVPDELESTVPGDDDLRWPEDRRRYRLWQVPIPDKEDWPPPPPPEMDEAISFYEAERFKNLRARDHAD
jgi:hypothetical protein